MRRLIDAIREETLSGNIATVPVPIGPPIERFPLSMRPELPGPMDPKKKRKKKRKDGEIDFKESEMRGLIEALKASGEREDGEPLEKFLRHITRSREPMYGGVESKREPKREDWERAVKSSSKLSTLAIKQLYKMLLRTRSYWRKQGVASNKSLNRMLAKYDTENLDKRDYHSISNADGGRFIKLVRRYEDWLVRIERDPRIRKNKTWKPTWTGPSRTVSLGGRDSSMFGNNWGTVEVFDRP